MSFVLGNFKAEVELFIHSRDAAEFASDSGGLEFLGTIPGFLADVRKRNNKSYKTCHSYDTNNNHIKIR